jgi:hypothetical protein
MLLSSSTLQIVLKWQAMSPSSSFTLVDFFPFLILNLSHSFYSSNVHRLLFATHFPPCRTRSQA